MTVKKIISLAIVVAVFTAIFLGTKNHIDVCFSCALKNINGETIQHFIGGFGNWGIVIYVFLYTANTFTPFVPPIFFMSLSAGVLFGPVVGTIALTLGTFCGTTAAFFTARYVGRSWIEKLIQGKGADIYDKLSQNGFFILLPMRLVGLPPYGIIDFICGLSKMKYVDFAAATMLGAAPWIITQVLLADRIANFNPKDPVLWGSAIAFVLMIVITSKIVKNKQAQEEATTNG